MKYFLIALLAFTTTRCAYAAPPSCYPPNGSAEMVPTVIIQSGGACVQWHCPDATGHLWQKAGICGTWSEATTDAITQLKAAMANDKATNDALWTKTFNARLPSDSPDVPLLNAAKLTPYPTIAPPGGLVTQDVFAWALMPINGKMQWQKVGTTLKGLPCDATQKIDNFYRIDRTKVKYPSGVLMPLMTFGTCTQ